MIEVHRSCTKVHCHERALYFKSTFFHYFFFEFFCISADQKMCSALDYVTKDI